MTTSGGPSFSSTSSKSRATCARSCASHANADAPVSAHKPLSFSGLRAASATDNSDCASSRASDALRPSPAPTIRAVLYAGVIQVLPDDVVLRDNDVAAYQQQRRPDQRGPVDTLRRRQANLTTCPHTSRRR